MKIIYNKLIPFPGFAHMNIFGLIFARKDQKMKLTLRTINHESIHTEQYKDLFYVLFLIVYLIEWIIKSVIGIFVHKSGYRSISLEQEAFYHQYDYNYIDHRKRFNWLKYVFTMYDQNKAYKRQGPEIYVNN